MERCTFCGTDGFLRPHFPAPAVRLALCEYCLAAWYECSRPGRLLADVRAEVERRRRPAARALTHLIVRE